MPVSILDFPGSLPGKTISGNYLKDLKTDTCVNMFGNLKSLLPFHVLDVADVAKPA